MILTQFTDGDYPVIWSRSGNTHTITYGWEKRTFTGYNADLKAAKEFGLCVRHSLECAGKLD